MSSADFYPDIYSESPFAEDIEITGVGTRRGILDKIIVLEPGGESRQDGYTFVYYSETDNRATCRGKYAVIGTEGGLVHDVEVMEAGIFKLKITVL